ncbi:MAG: FKBP-type peptidyl-prolyl cis-trans isomerase [Acidobacteria bacterium]|nr:FKBP-type peptidyl-prolyl cis-trans isomerase [Acidobacteriota bacterium]
MVSVFRSTLGFVMVAVLPALMAGCGDLPANPTGSPSFTKTELRLGSGAEAVSGSVVAVNYVGWLYDASKGDMKGVQFDSSVGRGPLGFTLGAGQVIEGFDQGILGMKVGGLRRLIIPPDMGYGNTRTSTIPPNSSLVFEVELLEVK